MTDNEIGRTIRFPQSLWDALDRDAQRCKRSSVKQLEAVLSAYYGVGGVELNNEKLERMLSDKEPVPPIVTIEMIRKGRGKPISNVEVKPSRTSRLKYLENRAELEKKKQAK